jgi:hypothetical protein
MVSPHKALPLTEMKTRQYITRMSQITTLFFAAIHLGFLGAILYYFQRLQREKCECALTNDYKVLRGILLFLLAYNILTFILIVLIYAGVIQSLGVGSKTFLLSAIGFSVLIVDLVFYILSIRYIRGLYQNACKCSDNGYRLVYFIYSIARVVIISFVLIFYIFLLLGLILFLRKV